MDLERKFISAVDVISNLPSNGPYQPSHELQLQFYAYYQQATQGPCQDKRPGFWDVVERSRHDAWSRLGSMSKTAAMTKYVENLEKIIETMNFSPDVENFMEAVGPFYEDVTEEEDRLEKLRNKNKRSSVDVSDNIIDNIISTITEEDPNSINDMLGKYDISDSSCLTDGTEDSDFLNDNSEQLKNIFLESRRGTSLSELTDFKDNNNCPNKLFEELQRTRASLQEAKNQMEATLNQTKLLPNIEPVSGKLSQRDIDRMLGNIDGFIPQPEPMANNSETLTNVIKVEVDSDGDDVFEDSVEDVSPQSDSIEVISPGISEHHFNVEATIAGKICESPSPPPAPRHHPKYKSSDDNLDNVEDDDEILVVTTENDEDIPDDSLVVDNIDYHLALAVDRLTSDIQHLQARVESIETIVVLRHTTDTHIRQRKCLWPFQDLNPSTVLFLVSWPVISHGLFHLGLAAFKRFRPR